MGFLLSVVFCCCMLLVMVSSYSKNLMKNMRLPIPCSLQYASIENIFHGDLPLKQGQIEGVVDTVKVKKSKNGPSECKIFARTDRIEGQRRWMKEILNLKISCGDPTSDTLSGINVILELSKELLYSGIPEMVLELYASYYDTIVKNNTTVVKNEDNYVPVVPDTKLILTTIRAFIKLKDVSGALSLLQAVSRVGLEFDMTSKSLLISDLAECSPQGLQVALRIRTSMNERNETITVTGISGILRGLLLHGLQPRKPDTKLLMDASSEEKLLNEESGGVFRLSSQSAYDLAWEIGTEYISHLEQSGKTRQNHKVTGELLRVIFRSAATLSSSQIKGSYTMNFDEDKHADAESKSKEGLLKVIEACSHFNINWDLQICDVIIDECLRNGDITGIRLMIDKMWDQNLYARTSTLNALLRRYAEIGDGENAYHFVMEVMPKGGNMTVPNTESYSLLLEACMKTTRGRYYASKILTVLQDSNLMTKSSWDRLLELHVVSGESYEDDLRRMTSASFQPDEDTILLLLEAFRSTGNVDGARSLYSLQTKGEIRRRAYRKITQDGIHDLVQGPDAGASDTERLGLLLPPPSRRTNKYLLEILRDAGQYERAVEVLRDMCRRAKLQLVTSVSRGDTKEVEPAVASTYSHRTSKKSKPLPLPLSLTISGREIMSALESPDVQTFTLVIDACIEAKQPDLALEVFAEMEDWGLAAERQTFSSLVKAFGLKNDVPSAIGVFQEMRRVGFVPDVYSLQSILDVCLKDRNPSDIAQACLMLTAMADEGADLLVYSNDILMQAFPDARSLGAALAGMETEPLDPRVKSRVNAGLDVISALVQAVRVEGGVAAMAEALRLLGSLGITAEPETMEYFRPPAEPTANSPHSRHYRRQLLPHKQRMRSLLDMEFPEGLGPILDLPDRKSGMSATDSNVKDSGRNPEPYFEPGQNSWNEHESALMMAVKGLSDRDAGSEDDDETHSDSNPWKTIISHDLFFTPKNIANSGGVDKPLELSENLLMRNANSRPARSRRSVAIDNMDVGLGLHGTASLLTRSLTLERPKRQSELNSRITVSSTSKKSKKSFKNTTPVKAVKK